MEWLQQLHFIRPDWLYALIPLLIVVIIGLNRSHTSMSWKAVCDEALLPHMLTQPAGVRNMLPIWLTAIITALSIIAAAGPAWEKLPQPVYRDQSAVVIALDLSQSMNATDIKPSRLSRARLKLLDILKLRSSGQTALLVYAADAFVVAPLTDDTDTIAHLVPTLETSIMPAQGSDTLNAIERANELLQQAGITNGHIILLTDGINAAQTDRIGASMQASHRLSIIGFGTAEGSPIPMTGGFLTDRHGDIVIPALDEASLRKAAAAGGGLYRSMRTDDIDIENILALSTSSVDMNEDEVDLTADSWREEGPWLLLLVIPLAALFARRGWLAVLVVMILPVPPDAHAFEIKDLWSTPDQRAMHAFEQGDLEAAADTFEDPRWKASALYQQGNYEAAIEQAGEPSDSDAFYNMGNAMAKSGKLEPAVEAYDHALELDPDNDDAAYNKQLVKDAIEQRDKQQQQQDQQGDSDSEQKADTQKDDKPQQQQSSQDKQKGSNEQKQDSDEAGTEQDGAPQESGEMDKQQGEENTADKAEQGQTEQDEAEHAREQQGAEKQASNIEQAAETDKAMQNDSDEQARATEQWLQRIPDDPGGLLRRKFQYQYKQRSRSAAEQQPW